MRSQARWSRLSVGLAWMLITSAGWAQTTQPIATAARETNFNFGWLFSKTDPAGATMPEFKDEAWRAVDLPHDWSIEGPFSVEWASGTGFSPGGIAWYRKHFKLDAAQKSKRVAIEFDGAYANAEVYLNGFLVGGRPYGFSSFECDLTQYLKFGGADNVLAVRIDHARFADSRFYTGSGIDRNVRLRMTDNVHVASHGVYITTPQVSDASASVHVETTIEIGNGTKADSAQAVLVQADILDGDGNAVPGASALVESPVDGSQTLNLELKVDHPHRWSIKSPTLYAVRTRVVDSKQNVIDETTTPFGIRTIRFDPNQGFFLNDVSMKLKGVCIHHDAGCIGAAVPEKVIARRLQLLKEIGVNAIRTSHNPPDPQLLDLCDRMGLVVMDEAFDEFMPAKNKWVEGTNVGVPSRSGYAELFAQWSTTDMGDMVRRDRNHPSIIMWSIGNEVDYANDPFSEPVLGNRYKPQNPPATELTRLGKPLVAAVKKFDLTRPVTAAMANVPVSNAAQFAEIFDVDGYNYQEARYAADHAKFPERIIYGSENGHRYNDWLAVRDNEFISGQFLWTGIDYLGESRGWPSRGSSAGLLDTSGVKKPNGWFRQSLWSDQPMVYLCTSAPGSRPSRGGTASDNGQGPAAPQPATQPQFNGGFRAEETWNRAEGSSTVVTCYSNCDEVQLSLNDKPIGSKKAAEAVEGAFTWTLPFEPGRLKAIGLKNGKVACEFELKTAGQAARIVLTTDDKTLHADATDVCHVSVTIVDAQGVRVPDAKNPVTFKITGPAKLLGIDNGEMVGPVDYAAAEHATFHGRALAIIQTTATPGAIQIQASSAGLEASDVAVASR